MALMLLERGGDSVIFADPRRITAVWNGFDPFEELKHEVNVRLDGTTFVIRRFETEAEAGEFAAHLVGMIAQALNG